MCHCRSKTLAWRRFPLANPDSHLLLFNLISWPSPSTNSTSEKLSGIASLSIASESAQHQWTPSLVSLPCSRSSQGCQPHSKEQYEGNSNWNKTLHPILLFLGWAEDWNNLAKGETLISTEPLTFETTISTSYGIGNSNCNRKCSLNTMKVWIKTEIFDPKEVEWNLLEPPHETIVHSTITYG